MRMRDRLRYAKVSVKSLIKPAILEYSERHIRNLERDNASLSGDNTTLERDKAALERAAAALERDKAVLEAHKAALERDNASLAGDKASLERDRAALEQYNAALRDLNGRLKSVVYQLLFGKNVTLAPGADEPAEIDALPVPPPLLRYFVAGTDDLDWFIKAGRLGAECLADVLAKQGKTLGQCRRILDFGCGCGRVTRHLAALANTEVHGTDPNWKAIEWCREHLRFAKFTVNAMRPPVSYEDGMFDLIYAFSIFTHLNESTQVEWLQELRRILSPAGHLIVTTHGSKCAENLSPAELAGFHSGKAVIRDETVMGSNYCMTWQSEGRFRSLVAPYFRVVDFIPEGARGNPPQDLFLLAR